MTTGDLTHYVLFGSPDRPMTQVNVLLAQDYLLTCRPMFGFSPEEAAGACRVTIIGGADAVGQDIEDRLLRAGVQVQRVEGSEDEVAQTLAQFATSSQPSS